MYDSGSVSRSAVFFPRETSPDVGQPIPSLSTQVKYEKMKRWLQAGLYVGREVLSRNPKSDSRIPKPENRDPRPENRNPKPETRNPKSETCSPDPEPKAQPRRQWWLQEGLYAGREATPHILKLRVVSFGTVLELRTTPSQKCEAVARRARCQGS